MATTKTKKTTSSTVHQYVSTTPANSLPEYNRKEYHWDDYNKGMPGEYQRKEYHWNDYNKGMPGEYKADTYTADTYNGPGYNASQYKSDYQLGNYNSKYMPDIEQRVNNIANWQYDPLQDASYQALAQVYGARGNLAAKNSLADAAALNGGYGTSYATSAAQQARNQYNQELMSMIPQLEQAAYNRAQTGLSALMDLDQTQYGRYRDTEADKQWLEQNRQNVHQMNQDDLYRAAQFGLDVFNTNTANKQWAAGMNQSEKAKAYDSLWDIYSTDLANRQWVSQMNQAERNKLYDSQWDVYNAKNANRQYVSGMNQGERQFAYNAGMDAAQLANDYYQWATNTNNSLWEYNEAQKKAASGGGGGGGRRGGGGGGYSGYVDTGDTGTVKTPTLEDARLSYIQSSGKNEKNTQSAKGLTTVKEKNKKSGGRLVK